MLVERVEGFATEAEWRRAYREINDFERQLTNHGIILVKLWFHISPEEQLMRFEARKETPHKRWKLTEEDWRNREKWEQYEQAVEDMLQKTSTVTAPWTIIEGNDKYWERVKTQRTVIEALAPELEKSVDDKTSHPPESKNKEEKEEGLARRVRSVAARILRVPATGILDQLFLGAHAELRPRER